MTLVRHCLWFSLLMSVMSVMPASAEVVRVDGEALESLRTSGVPVIDVRRPDEWRRTGVIEGSHRLTFFDANGRYDLEQWLAQLRKIAGPGERFVLICRSGGRSGAVSRLLDEQLGYTQVHDAAGGILKWLEAGRPVVSVE
ncbi:MAG: rhodanese-like domain-containing protein [Pseudomonadota bacterium]